MGKGTLQPRIRDPDSALPAAQRGSRLTRQLQHDEGCKRISSIMLHLCSDVESRINIIASLLPNEQVMQIQTLISGLVEDVKKTNLLHERNSARMRREITLKMSRDSLEVAQFCRQIPADILPSVIVGADDLTSTDSSSRELSTDSSSREISSQITARLSVGIDGRDINMSVCFESPIQSPRSPAKITTTAGTLDDAIALADEVRKIRSGLQEK